MHARRRERRRPATALICLIVMILCSCVGLWPDRIGRIVPNREAALIFEKKQCNADYHYYYSGSDLYPHALMGLRKDLNLEKDTQWKKIDMSPQRCRDMVSHIETRALGLGLFPYGFVIQDDRSVMIGIWYSILTATAPVWMKDDHTAVIHTPAVDTYIRYEKDPE